MSTKTTFKRIALVAVAALGLSIVSVAPSGAAVQADSLNHFKVATCSASGTVGATNVATTAGVYSDCGNYDTDSTNVLINGTAVFGIGQSYLSSAIGDAATVTVKLVTNAYNGTAETVDGVLAYSIPTALPVVTAGTYGNHINSTGNITQTVSADGLVLTNTSTATGSITGAAKVSFTPTLRGTYVITMTPQTGSLGKAKTWTVNAYATQAALDLANGVDNAISATGTTSFLNAGETTTVTGAADTVVAASMALSASAQRATIVVTPKNAAGTTISNVTFPITATISGPGTLGIDSAANVASIASAGRAVTGTTGHYAIGVFSDGTAGVATITISSGTTVLATETVTFYGAAAKITPTVVNSVLKIGANTGAITAVVTDAAGVLVPGVTVYASSNTDATIDDAYVASTAVSTSAGLVSFDLTGAAKGTAQITLTLNSSSAGTSTVSAVAGTMRVSDGVATKVAYTFGKDTYAPGEAAVITATVSNAEGVMPAGTYTVLSSAGVTSNYTVGSLPAATVLAVGSTGAATYTVTIPTGITGDLQLAGTSAATTIAATFGKTTVVNVAQDVAQAAVDAAAEAIDAANAATDAANAAAEAADAATAAAQDAADAVAALSVSVAAMIDALKKQITSLTNLVIKIQKKVKA
jgi:uncharacterized protein YaaQ